MSLGRDDTNQPRVDMLGELAMRKLLDGGQGYSSREHMVKDSSKTTVMANLNDMNG